MEIVIIEKKAFEALLSGIATLTGKVNLLTRKCDDRHLAKWLDGEDVCRMLRISPRTLQTLRDNRIIGYSRFNRKFYYKTEEVARLLPLMGHCRTVTDQV
ncbi:helix-turn-helix domain-containing protein [Alistipes putredinis]|uniref:helix-turn-helix domain-containing protein n=1 Tax=Alistipes putredinis TaxID=28117 RepID=UPI003FD81C2E